MPRPCKKKCVSSIPSYTAFIHTDEPIPASHIQMSVEEYETIRLIDYLGWNQEECAKQMQTSRGSVQSLYNEARRKLSRFLMEGSAMVIAGGNYQLNLAQKPTGDDSMKIAVTYDNGQVFQHFKSKVPINNNPITTITSTNLSAKMVVFNDIVTYSITW